ncbi:MAG: hypothetical protein ACI4WX_04985, partial [Aristaeellaceae bacterium]
PPILWVQKASYVGFPLFCPSGWVHDKTAAGCLAGSRFILGAYEVFLIRPLLKQIAKRFAECRLWRSIPALPSSVAEYIILSGCTSSACPL